MTKSNILGLFLLGLALAVGISVGGYFIGQTMYNAKIALNTAEAKGLAERVVEADHATWTIIHAVTGKSRSELPNLYKASENHQASIIQLLKENGFTDAEISIGVLDYSHQEFRDKNQLLKDQKHTLRGSITVNTNQVKQVAKARSQVNTLIAAGIDLVNQAPAYRFTGLNAIKPEMLKEAAKNARIAANEFAANAGTRVGKIRSARQGSFFIRDFGEEYGDRAKIKKNVRVVTTITFYLDD